MCNSDTNLYLTSYSMFHKQYITFMCNPKMHQDLLVSIYDWSLCVTENKQTVLSKLVNCAQIVLLFFTNLNQYFYSSLLNFMKFQFKSI